MTYTIIAVQIYDKIAIDFSNPSKSIKTTT